MNYSASLCLAMHHAARTLAAVQLRFLGSKVDPRRIAGPQARAICAEAQKGHSYQAAIRSQIDIPNWPGDRWMIEVDLGER